MHLKESLITAINNTPFYQKCGISVFAVNDMTDIPILTKQDVVCAGANIRSKQKNRIPPVIVSTSGSSGVPLRIQWDQLDYCSSLMETWRFRRELGVFPSDNFVSAHVFFENGDGTFLTNKAIVQKNNLSLSKLYFDEATLLYYHQLICDFRPKWLLLPPSFLYGFISFLNSRQLSLPTSIVLIELTGELCAPEVYKYFVELYPNIKWRILYGMQEFNTIAYGEPTGLRVLNNNVHVEIIDDLGLPANFYEEGDIVVTGLKNHVTPLVRYKTEDRGYFDTNGMLHVVRAKSNDHIKINDRVYDGSIFWILILKLQKTLDISVLQFQVILENNKLMFYLKTEKPVTQKGFDISAWIKEHLIRDFKLSYDVAVINVDKIVPSSNSNKIKYFINKQLY